MLRGLLAKVGFTDVQVNFLKSTPVLTSAN